MCAPAAAAAAAPFFLRAWAPAALQTKFQKANDRAGHVDAGYPFYPFQTRRRVNFQDTITIPGLDQVDAGDVQGMDLGCFDRQSACGLIQLYGHGAATEVQVGAKVTGRCPPLYFGGDAFGGPRVEGAALSGLALAAALMPES